MFFPFRRQPDPSRRRLPGRDDAIFDPAAEPPIPDELVDHMLDGEVDPASAREVLGAIRRDDAASERLDSTHDILSQLKTDRRAGGCPDFSACILGRVHAERGLFSRSGLRRLYAYRTAAAAALLLFFGGLFVAQRLAPDAVRFEPVAAPISQVVSAVPVESAGVFSGVHSFVETIRAAVPAPAPSPIAVRRITALNDAREDQWCSRINPPIASVLWVDDRDCGVRFHRAACRGQAECDYPARWDASGQRLPSGVFGDDAARRARESGVVFVTFSR